MNLDRILSGETDLVHQRLRKMPPRQAKFYLNELHLEGRISAADYAYWLDALDIDPSL